MEKTLERCMDKYLKQQEVFNTILAEKDIVIRRLKRENNKLRNTQLALDFSLN